VRHNLKGVSRTGGGLSSRRCQWAPVVDEQLSVNLSTEVPELGEGQKKNVSPIVERLVEVKSRKRQNNKIEEVKDRYLRTNSPAHVLRARNLGGGRPSRVQKCPSLKVLGTGGETLSLPENTFSHDRVFINHTPPYQKTWRKDNRV